MDELLAVYRDLAAVGVNVLTIGQYLRPSKDHLPIARYYTPDEFAFMKREALAMGFRHVESGPLVRSSYHAHEQSESQAPPRQAPKPRCRRAADVTRPSRVQYLF